MNIIKKLYWSVLLKYSHIPFCTEGCQYLYPNSGGSNEALFRHLSSAIYLYKIHGGRQQSVILNNILGYMNKIFFSYWVNPIDIPIKIFEEGTASRYDFAHAIMDYSGIACQVYPLQTEEYPAKAKRPAYSILCKAKIRDSFNLAIPHWTEGLKRCVRKIEAAA